MSNEDHFKLRENYKEETGLTAFDKDSILTYVNWLEKKLVKKQQFKKEIELQVLKKCSDVIQNSKTFN